MKNNNPKLLNEKGVSAIIVAVLLVVLLGIGALAIDIGYLAVAKNECQNAADAAALAGARQLGENYANKTDLSANVVAVAKEIAEKNKAAGQFIIVGNNDIQIGTWNPATSLFLETITNPMAVWVRTTATPSTFFARIFSILNMNVAAEACAIIGGPCEGSADVPIGISEAWFAKNSNSGPWCGTSVSFGDTLDSCAGWTNLSGDRSNINLYKDIECMLTCANPDRSDDCTKCANKGYMSTIPESLAGANVDFKGGWSNELTDLQSLFEKKKDADGTWTTEVIVYKESGTNCGNPTGSQEIIGFTTLKITAVEPTGKTMGITGQVLCEMTEPEPGGCFSGGIMGTIPRLAQLKKPE